MAAASGSFGRAIVGRRAVVGGMALAAAGLVLPLGGAQVWSLAQAAELRFEVPVDCEIGTRCTVQNYIDHDPGPGAKDQTCGPLTYDGHDGIDIRVATRRDMEEGVPVVAAAAGMVKALRDGMEDISIRDPGASSVRGREAGNSVIVDHGDGWETQYSHMRRGSVAVEVGERVEVGDRLGLIGLSGNTEFPHLHFSVRRWKQTLDPFTGLLPGRGCGEETENLWSESAQSALEYQAGGLLAAGFITERPLRYEEARAGFDSPASAPPNTSLIGFYALAWGLRGGDRETIRITLSSGQLLTEKTSAIPGDKAQWYRYIAGKRPSGGWPLGTYTAEYRIEREEGGRLREVIAVTREIEVR